MKDTLVDIPVARRRDERAMESFMIVVVVIVFCDGSLYLWFQIVLTFK